MAVLSTSLQKWPANYPTIGIWRLGIEPSKVELTWREFSILPGSILRWVPFDCGFSEKVCSWIIHSRFFARRILTGNQLRRHQ